MASKSGRTLSIRVVSDLKDVDKLDNLGRKLSKFGAATTLGVTLPLAAAGTAAFKFASDLDEASNKAATVFGDSVGKIDAEAASLNDLFDEATFRDMAGTFGALLKNMGFTSDAAADLSVKWIRLAEDMGSFHNVDPTEALQAIQSALSGEFEPLKRFGVRLDETTVKAKALEAGLWDGTGALDAQARAIIVNQELFAQQSDVIGDATRTADGAANTMRRITANFVDALARLGQELLPIGTDILGVVEDVVTGFADLDDGMQGLIITAGLAAAALGPLLGVLGNILRVAKGIQTAAPWLFAAAPLAGMVALKAGADEANDALFGGQAIFGDAGRKSVQTWFDSIFGGSKKAGGAVEDLAETSRDNLANFSDAVIANQDAWLEYEGQVSTSVTNAVEAVEESVADMADQIAQAPGEMADALLDNQFKVTDAIDELTAAMETSLSPAVQAFHAQAFLASQEYAAGLASGDPAVRAKAAELAAAAEAAIARNSLYDSGRTFSRSFAYGMTDPAVIDFVKQSAYRVALAARGIFPSSEPKDPRSPFRGITDAFGFTKIFADGLTKHDDVIPNALRNALRFDPALGGSFGAGGGSDGSTAGVGAPGGVTINVNVSGNLEASERTLPSTMSRAAFVAGLDEEYGLA